MSVTTLAAASFISTIKLRYDEERPRSPRTWEESLHLRLHTELHDIVLHCMILVYIIIHIHLQLHRHNIIIIMYMYILVLYICLGSIDNSYNNINFTLLIFHV